MLFRLRVEELIALTVDGVPATKTQQPEIKVVARSLATNPLKGVLRLKSRFFAAGSGADFDDNGFRAFGLFFAGDQVIQLFLQR